MKQRMAEPHNTRETWLVAAWPGMGSVGVAAAAYLVNKLSARLIHEVPARDVFDQMHIDVKEGLARAGRLPRSMFFEWSNPSNNHDLLIFLGEAQPPHHGYSFCHKLLDYAAHRDIKRIVTFAAMATQLHPKQSPRVFGVATNGETIRELQALESNILKEGQISGLNGVLLAAGLERGIPGMCLLGELPFFAAGVPNPKASKAVLELFATMADIEIDLTDIDRQAKAVEQTHMQILEKLREATKQQQAEAGEEGFSIPDPEAETDEPADEQAKKSKKPALDFATRQRIESMFEAANQDRTKAFALKEELDRLGVFEQYENRFLDLFKKAD